MADKKKTGWLAYFFGTPQRATRSAIAIGLVVVMLRPGLLFEAANRLVKELSPFFGPLLTLLIIAVGAKKILGGRK